MPLSLFNRNPIFLTGHLTESSVENERRSLRLTEFFDDDLKRMKILDDITYAASIWLVMKS